MSTPTRAGIQTHDTSPSVKGRESPKEFLLFFLFFLQFSHAWDVLIKREIKTSLHPERQKERLRGRERITERKTTERVRKTEQIYL